jgi:selenocysteine lyase/cysteine desulfurase
LLLLTIKKIIFMDIIKAREYFPHLKKGITYLNHAATGPFSKPVLDVMDEYFRARSEDNIDDYPAFVKTIEETKELLTVYFNCEPQRLAFADNTTNGLNMLAQGFDWKEKDEIILNDIEFPANVYPFLNLERKGVKIVFVKSRNGIVTAEDIIEKITSKTKLISVSMVQFLSGYRIDLEKLGKVCRERNIFLCVDAIQGLGALSLDTKKCNIDFVSCGTQKWMLGLQGLSFIYISEELQQKLTPAFVGWLGVNDAWNLLDYNLSLKDSAERFQPGSLNSAGIYALNASLKLFKEFGLKEIEEKVISNSQFLIDNLKEINLNPLLFEIEKKFLSGIVSFKHADANSILEGLKEKNIMIAVREGIVRISPHFYNTGDDFEKLIDSLKILI